MTRLKQISEQVVARFGAAHRTLGTAESLTGGMIASSVAGVSGASAVLMGGVVSEPCARQMAEGARRVLKVDVAVSATGVAGPTGGTPQTPVGTVFLGVSGPKGTRVEECHFAGDRAQVRAQSAARALEMALEALE